MAELFPFHGIHPLPARSACARVSWSPSTPRAHRVRIRAHTCECRTTIYELCAAGGLFFVRRTDRGKTTPKFAESDWLAMREAEALWLRILNGQAR